MQDLLSTFHSSKIFSSLDLKQGYHQIPLSPNSIKFTSFLIANEQYEFLRLPFGLKNAPMEFQRAINILFGDLKFFQAYLDDIIIFSSSINEHSQHVKIVFEIIKKNKISVNFAKSKFFVEEIPYLGHLITSQSVKPDPKRLKQYEEIKTPTCLKDVQSLLGLINWSRGYVPNLSIKLEPISRKLRKGCKFNWTQQDDKIISDVFKDINKGITIFYPNFKEPY